jgi:hypothetical protein
MEPQNFSSSDIPSEGQGWNPKDVLNLVKSG